jgi:hypothetical protein
LFFTGITLDPPVVTISASKTSVCVGETITLTATAVGDKTFTYAWNNDNTTETANSASWVVTPTQTTIYTVIVTDANGFTASASQQIEVKPRPEVTISDSLVEVGNTLTLSPETGGIWTSSNPAVAVVDGATVTAISAGSATFTFTETATGCSNTTGLVTITQPENNMLKSGMGIMGTQTFTSSGNFTVPAGVTSVTVELWGGGGAGGGANGGNSNARSGGGGAGGTFTLATVSVTPGEVIAVTVGAGGTGVSGDAGNPGGTSSFGTYASAIGGQGGVDGRNGARMGAGAPVSVGITYNGGSGATAPANNQSGGGGASAGSGSNGNNAAGTTGGAAVTSGGAGANGRTTTGNGVDATQIGGGGGGAYTNTLGVNYAGGAGFRGEVVITWVDAGTCSGNAVSQTNTNVNNANRALGAANNSGAELHDNGDILILDLTNGDLLTSGGNITIYWRRTNSNPNITVSTSDGSTWTTIGSYTGSDFAAVNTWTSRNITLTANTRYVRFASNNNENVQVDAVSFNTPCEPPCTNPDQPSVISGNTTPCPSTTVTYSVTNVPGVTYTWSYSGTNATIASGQGTNSINVNYASNATSGTWTVTPSVSTCTGPVRTLAVTVSTLSTNPTSVTGTNTICYGSSTTLTTNGGTLGTDADDVWYEGGCATEAVTQEWAMNPYAVSNTTVNSVSGGILSVTSTSGDPMIHMENIGSYSAAANRYIQIRYRVTGGTADNVEIYYSKTGGTDLSESQVVRTALVSDGNWNIANVDMSTSANWTGTITGWRYDWASQNGVTMQIDFITLSDRPIIGTGTSVTVSPTTTTTYYTRKKGLCNSTSCVSRTVTVNPLPTITLNPNVTACQGSTGANLNYSATENSPNQYSIDYDAAAQTAGFSDRTNVALSASPIVLIVPVGVSAGTYTATLTVRNGNGCVSAESIITITVNERPTITLGSNPAVCQGTTSAELNYSATTNAPDQYSINFNPAAEAQGFVDVPVTTLPASPITITVPAGATPATYNALLTVINSTTGCSSVAAAFTITVNPTPTMSSSDNKTICSGENVNLGLTSVVASSYSWIASDNVNVTGESTTAQTGSTINNVLVNTSTTVQTVTYTVTPTSTTGSCVGTLHKL